MDWSDAIDHFTEGDFTCRNETVFVLICDAVCVAGQNDQVPLRFANEECVIADGADGRRPDGLVVAADFSQLVLLAVLAGNVFDDADALH